MPTAVGGDDRVSVFRTPTATMVRANLVVGLEDGIDRFPGGFHGIFAGEQRSVAGHGVAQEQFVRQLLAGLFLGQTELSLVADEFLPAALDPGGDGDGGLR